MLKYIVMLMLDPVIKLQSWFSELGSCLLCYVYQSPYMMYLKLYVTCIRARQISRMVGLPKLKVW